MGAKVDGGASGATSRLTTSSKEAKMKRVPKLSLAVAVVAAFEAAPSHAARPDRILNSHGFPGGEHNNLNIFGNND